MVGQSELAPLHTSLVNTPGSANAPQGRSEGGVTLTPQQNWGSQPGYRQMVEVEEHPFKLPYLLPTYSM